MSPGVYHRSWSEVIEKKWMRFCYCFKSLSGREAKKKKKKRKRKKPRMITREGDGSEKMEEGQPPALRVGMES